MTCLSTAEILGIPQNWATLSGLSLLFGDFLNDHKVIPLRAVRCGNENHTEILPFCSLVEAVFVDFRYVDTCFNHGFYGLRFCESLPFDHPINEVSNGIENLCGGFILAGHKVCRLLGDVWKPIGPLLELKRLQGLLWSNPSLG